MSEMYKFDKKTIFVLVPLILGVIISVLSFDLPTLNVCALLILYVFLQVKRRVKEAFLSIAVCLEAKESLLGMVVYVLTHMVYTTWDIDANEALTIGAFVLSAIALLLIVFLRPRGLYKVPVTPEEKLIALKEQMLDGGITEEEYNQQRKVIIDQL